MKQLKILLKRFCNLMGKPAVLIMVFCLFIYAIDYVLLSVMPGLILKLVGNTEKLIWIAFLIVMMVGCHILSGFIKNKRDNLLFLFRIKEIGNVQKACMEITPMEIETGTGKDDIEQSMQAVCSGNDFGIEAYLTAILNIITLCVTFGLYLVILHQLPWWVYCVIFTGILIKIPYENKWQRIDESELNKNYKERAVQEEFRRCTLQEEFAKDIRLFQGQDFATQKLRQNTLPILNYAKKREFRRNRRAMVLHALSLLRNIALLSFFAFHLDSYAAEDIAFYFGAFLGMDALIESLMQDIGELRNNRESVKSYCAIFDKGCKPLQTEGKEMSNSLPYSVVFSHVAFSYPNHPIFDDLSFKIHQGEKIAVIGENGVGKTTLIKLILGVIRPEKGVVLINGEPIPEGDLSMYWEDITVSFQDSVILPFTLKENISGKTPDQTDEERFKKAIINSGIRDMVDSLPNGENSYCTTNYDVNGINFSGGQKQRLYMARMLYKKADWMLLDEPTAALDAKAEAEIYEQYDRVTQEKISFFVSHRLSSTKFCDKILFIEDSSNVYLESFQYLYENNKKFRCMYDTQSSYYRRNPYVLQ